MSYIYIHIYIYILRSLPSTFRCWKYRVLYICIYIYIYIYIAELTSIFRCWKISRVVCMYIFVSLILVLWHRETLINQQRNRWIIVDPAGIELTASRLRQHRQLPVVQHDRFMPLKLCQKHNPNDMPGGCIGQLTTRLECKGFNLNTRGC